MLGELDEIQIKNVLCSQVLGRMACTDGLQPYIVPVTFTYDGKQIYGQTNEGYKLELLRNNPLVCFEASMMTDMNNWQSVLVFGQFEELAGDEAERARELLFNRVYSLMTSTTLHKHQHGTEHNLNNGNRVKDIMYRIKINKLSGRFEKN